MSYKAVKLEDICTRIVSGGTPKATIESFYNPKEIPWLKTGEVNYSRIYDTVTYISQDGLDRSSAKLIPINSVIIAMYGQGDTAGRVAINKIPLSTNQACCNLIIDKSKANYEYIYYLLTMLYEKLVSLKNGGAQPNLNVKTIRNIEITLPDLNVQNIVATILSTYDNLIENNQKQIKLLEEAAQRLYKEWFIDLRFPGYENMEVVDGIPVEWEYLEFLNIAPIITGKKDVNFGSENGKYLFFTCSQQPLLAESYSYDCDAVILAGNGDFNVKLYRGKFEAYQRTYVLSPYKSEHLYLLFYTIKNRMNYLIQGASGSTIKFLTKGMIADIKVLVPTCEILNQYNEIAEPLQRKLEVLIYQNKLLTEARDRLLPKLMSGEIVV